MPSPVTARLKITENTSLLALNAPPGFRESLSPLPRGARITTNAKDYDQIHWFVRDQAQLEKELSRVMKLMKPGVLAWVYYPKGSSGLQTDLTRDKGWDCLMAESDRLTWVNLISFNDTWSAFGFRAKTEADRKRDAKPKKEREVFQWVNPATREVKLPPDLATALKKHREAATFFESLSFTNKKEYIGWIVSAKRDETRASRIEGTLERLAKGLKNPRNL
ncbi:MAG TPA: YdeI/OmpD-associated family protein [Chitinophagaceae bacterium]|nr:YdeI/OmpD-associated family protein [Chitinophagaceae bacterium]